MSDELLPCPFCGGAPKKVNFDVHRTCVGFEWIECEGCKVMVEVENSGLSGEDCRAKLIAAWNRRTASRAAMGEVGPRAPALFTLFNGEVIDLESKLPNKVTLHPGASFGKGVPISTMLLGILHRQLHEADFEKRRAEDPDFERNLDKLAEKLGWPGHPTKDVRLSDYLCVKCGNRVPENVPCRFCSDAPPLAGRQMDYDVTALMGDLQDACKFYYGDKSADYEQISDCRARLLAACAPSRAGLGGEWRGIDSCPENLMVLIACPNGTIWIASKDGDEWFGIEDDFGTVIEPSHWMNLPPPPAADDRGVEG